MFSVSQAVPALFDDAPGLSADPQELAPVDWSRAVQTQPARRDTRYVCFARPLACQIYKQQPQPHIAANPFSGRGCGQHMWTSLQSSGAQFGSQAAVRRRVTVTPGVRVGLRDELTGASKTATDSRSCSSGCDDSAARSVVVP